MGSSQLILCLSLSLSSGAIAVVADGKEEGPGRHRSIGRSVIRSIGWSHEGQRTGLDVAGVTMSMFGVAQGGGGVPRWGGWGVLAEPSRRRRHDPTTMTNEDPTAKQAGRLVCVCECVSGCVCVSVCVCVWAKGRGGIITVSDDLQLVAPSVMTSSIHQQRERESPIFLSRPKISFPPIRFGRGGTKNY